jgi:hypothetical protein
MLDWEKVVINKKRVIALLISLACLFASGSRQPVIAAQKPTQAAPIVIPFEFVTRHIVIKVRINNSDPLRFILDTGDKVAIVDLNRAQSLGLTLQNEVRVGGAGAGTLKGSQVKDASLTVLGVEGNVQPVAMALPLDILKPNFGQEIDGIIGGDFIKQFVVEIDYPARLLRLHDKDKFTYSGPGEIIPIRLNGLGYPVVEGEVTAAGPPAVKAEFLLDIGSGGSLALHTPFVEQQHLPAPDQKTIRAIGGGGAGGKVTGKIGRIAELKIGTFQIQNPATLFSEDRAGAFATSQLQGNIGAQILTKFKVFLDYSRNRIILEPNASFKDLIAPASAGLRLVAVGADYKTFRVEDLLEASPATEAGLQVGDLVLTVDGHQASELTLSSLHESFEKPGPHKLTVRRGDQTLQLTVTSRRMV